MFAKDMGGWATMKVAYLDFTGSVLYLDKAVANGKRRFT